MFIILLIAGLVLFLGAYLLFRDTLNRIQYVEHLRVYWITRNTGVSGQPFVRKAFMRHTSPPYWRGSGIEIRVGSYTVQFGILTGKVDSLLDQLDGRELDVAPKDLRQW